MVFVVYPDMETMKRWFGETQEEEWSRIVVWERKSEMNQDSKLKEKLSQEREKRNWIRWEWVKKRTYKIEAKEKYKTLMKKRSFKLKTF